MTRGFRIKRDVQAWKAWGFDRSWFRNSKAWVLSSWLDVEFQATATACSIYSLTVSFGVEVEVRREVRHHDVTTAGTMMAGLGRFGGEMCGDVGKRT